MSSLTGALIRGYWMPLGHSLCGFAVLAILRTSTASWRDGLSWATVVSMIVARWIDVRWLARRTTDGEPATPAHARCFGVGVAADVACGSLGA